MRTLSFSRILNEFRMSPVAFLLGWRWRICIRSSPTSPFPPLPSSSPAAKRSPLNQLGVMGERCELPHRVRAERPAAKRFWYLLWAEKWLMLVLNIFILVIQL
jgi:hypothetical protein